MDIDEMKLKDDINTIGHPVRRAYLKGAARTTRELFVNMRDAASAGSPFSIAECQRQLNKMLANINL